MICPVTKFLPTPLCKHFSPYDIKQLVYHGIVFRFIDKSNILMRELLGQYVIPRGPGVYKFRHIIFLTWCLTTTVLALRPLIIPPLFLLEWCKWTLSTIIQLLFIVSNFFAANTIFIAGDGLADRQCQALYAAIYLSYSFYYENKSLEM